MIAAVAGALEVTLIDLTAAVARRLARATSGRQAVGNQVGLSLSRERPGGRRAERFAARKAWPRHPSAPSVERVSAKSHRDVPRDRRPRGAGLEPRQGRLPRAGADQARPRAVLPRRRRRGAARRRRPADGAQALREGHRRRAVLPEARAREPPRLHRHRDPALRPRHLGRRGGDPGCRGPGLGRESRMPRPQPAPGPRRGPRPSRRAARRPRPDARGATGRRSSTSPWSPARCSTTTGSWAGRRRADRAGLHILVRIAPEWDFTRRAARRRDPRPRGREPRTRARDGALVEGGARRERVRRLQPEREGPHRGIRVLDPRRSPTRASRRRWTGTRSRIRPPRGVHRARRCSSGSPSAATRTRASTTRSARSTGCCGSPRSSARPRSRRAAPSADGRRPRRCRSSRWPAPRPSPRRSRLLETWKARHPDVAALLHPADVLVDGMRGSSSLWYRVRINLQHVPEAAAPAAGRAARRLRPVGRQDLAGRPAD